MLQVCAVAPWPSPLQDLPAAGAQVARHVQQAVARRLGEPLRLVLPADAAAGRRAGKPLRAIAVDRYGRERVDADWLADSALRSKVRRLVRRSLDGAPGSGDGARPRGRR
ncbi:MAG: DUF2285 domain-containing protein [Alphaproteobacteria bacterium]|nr:DUF2285 domain-containing protein [Alphaproteobacteria bacterium]